MCRIILYCRVSTDEQSEGCSLEMQERFLRAYCCNHGDDVVDLYKEDYSAKHYELNRPEFKKLYDYCRKHRHEVDKVMFLRWDRYSRNVEFAFAYKRKLMDELGIEINAMAYMVYTSSFAPSASHPKAVVVLNRINPSRA